MTGPTLKIALHTPDFPPHMTGGVAIYCRELAYHLAKRGHQISVITPAYRGEENQDKRYELIHVPAKNRVEFISQSPQSLKGKRFDILHGNDIFHIAILFKRPKSIAKFVTTTHNSYLQRLKFYPTARKIRHLPLALLENYVYLRSDQIVAVSSVSLKFARSYFVDPDKLNVIENGVDPDKFCPLASDYVQRKFRLSDKIKLMLYVGRVEENKHPGPYVKALEHLDDNFHLVIVGNGSHINKIMQLAHQFGVSQRIHHILAVDYDTMPSVYNSVDLLVHNSVSEVGPFSLLEAAACGLPLLCNQNGMAIPVIQPGRNGYLFSNQKSAEIAEKILKITENSEIFAKESRKIIFERELTWQQVAAKYEKLYYKVIK